VEGQNVDLTVILTLYSYVTCQTGVCVCVCARARARVRACVSPLNTKMSVLNPNMTGLKKKVNHYTEQMSLLLMDLMCIWFNECTYKSKHWPVVQEHASHT
jgi:hypothetical protein